MVNLKIYVMQQSKAALRGLVCALKGIQESDVKNIEVLNPINLNSAGKETIMDLKLTLNNNEVLNIELQVYPDKHWIRRSILYLGRTYDSIGLGENYSQLKSTTLFCITDQELVENAIPEFYAKYRLSNLKNHQLYTDNFGINVLQLNHTDIATTEDIGNKLVYWAELFKASTWEEFKALAKDNPEIKEVGNLIFTLNYDNQAKELLEGQRRYREMMATQYADGYADAEEKYKAELSDKDATIADKDATISEKDDTIASLQAELAKYKAQENK